MILNNYDIILCKNPKKIHQKVVCWFTKNKYFHAEIYVENYHIIDDNIGGVKIRNFDNTLGEFDAYRYYREILPEEKELIDEFLQKSLNSRYDFWELVLQAFKKRGKRNNKYICISLLMEAFKYAGLEVGSWKQGFEQVCDSKYFFKIN